MPEVWRADKYDSLADKYDRFSPQMLRLFEL